MAYNESISDRIREALTEVPDVEEKLVFGGICYMGRWQNVHRGVAG